MREFAVGELIAGRYRIESTLGRGGMGVVYSARDTRLSRDVAVKSISAKSLGAASSPAEDPIVRFETEALATAKLENPHVVTVYDAGTEGEIPYLVMERLQGRDLESLMADQRGRPLEIDRAVHMMLEVCFGMAGAHAFQIFHRDLSSKNVFVTRHLTKVLDFGLARLRDGSRSTEKGFVRGTWQYMAPERFLGEDAGGLGDIYSIGVLLYETLTGTVPFFNESSKKPLTGDSLVPAILGGFYSSPRERNGELPEELERVILRAMAVRAQNRFESVHLLARDLLPFAPRAGRMLTEHFSGPEPVVQRIEVLTGRSSAPRSDPEPEDSLAAAARGKNFVLGREGVPLEAKDELANSFLMEDFSTVEARYDAATTRGAQQAASRAISPMVRESETSSERRWVQASEFRLSTSERESPGSRTKMVAGLGIVLSVAAVGAILASSKLGAEPQEAPAEPQTTLPVSAKVASAPAVAPPMPPTPQQGAGDAGAMVDPEPASKETSIARSRAGGEKVSKKPPGSHPVKENGRGMQRESKRRVKYEKGVPLLGL